jgi:hypothetical protein
VEHVAAALCHVADSRREAIARLGSAMPAWIAGGTGGYVHVALPPGPRREPASYVEHLLDIHPVGPPECCAERTGIRHFLLMVAGTRDPCCTLDTIERLGAGVAPLLTGYAAALDRRWWPSRPPVRPPGPFRRGRRGEGWKPFAPGQGVAK